MNIRTKHHNSRAVVKLILETAIKNEVDTQLNRRTVDEWVSMFTTYHDGAISLTRNGLFYGGEDCYSTSGFTEVTLDEFLASLERPQEIRLDGGWTVYANGVTFVDVIRLKHTTFDHQEILAVAEAIKKIKGKEQ